STNARARSSCWAQRSSRNVRHPATSSTAGRVSGDSSLATSWAMSAYGGVFSSLVTPARLPTGVGQPRLQRHPVGQLVVGGLDDPAGADVAERRSHARGVDADGLGPGE